MKNLLLLILLVFSILIGTSSCYTSTPGLTRAEVLESRKLPPNRYYIDTLGNGSYVPVELEKAPQPVQGQEQWAKDFYGSVRYPPSARENGISGKVIYEVLVNEMGKVEQVQIVKGLSRECNEETIRAYKNATAQGYIPLVYNSIPVKFKMEMSMGFWLE